MRSPSLSWSALRLSEPTQAAMQRAVAATAPAPATAPAEDLEEQTVEESNQHWAAISS